ncbi:MAG: ribonuclease T, partial [Cyanobacteria bacterium P01_D01_bin.73]
VTGTFTADTSCPALSSIRRQANPGNITIRPGTTYPLLGKNKRDATHYQIRIEDASPSSRWVGVACGRISEGISNSDRPLTDSDRNNPSQNSPGQNYVLAASWQPSFCETRLNKPECRSQTGDRFDATSFSIHGLWPRPVYCNVPRNIEQLDKDKRWSRLPELDLSPALRQELAIKMPGYQSYLHRHEWYKHGTCYSETPEEYYQETILLIDQLNASKVRTLLVRNLEKDITSQQVNQAFQDSFGAAGKVRISCKKVNQENLIDELKINLRGDINPRSNIADLLAAAPDVNNPGCRSGQVDSADD